MNDAWGASAGGGATSNPSPPRKHGSGEQTRLMATITQARYGDMFFRLFRTIVGIFDRVLTGWQYAWLAAKAYD